MSQQSFQPKDDAALVVATAVGAAYWVFTFTMGAHGLVRIRALIRVAVCT